MLEAVNVSHVFNCGTPFQRQVLSEVNLKLTVGQCLLVTGANGSGKTTLARIMSGLETPTSGSVHLQGEKLCDARRNGGSASLRRAMAFQYPERQFFARTVREEMSSGLRLGLGMSDSEIAGRLQEVAAQLDLPLAELAERSPRTLSSGQQRKVALAGVLVLEPHVLILDEPLAGLHTKEGRRLAALLRRWSGRDRALLIIAHELEFFLEWVDRVAVMAGGRLIFFGAPEEISNQRVLGTPPEAGRG